MTELLPEEQERHHAKADPHFRGRWLSDVILGAQDGLVNTLGVVLGVAAASGAPRIVLAAGMAAAVAESVSMAAVGYSSSVARGDLFQSERAREYRHLETTPDIEREEIRRIYAEKGFGGPLLDRVVDTICANKDVWVAVMMAEEHALAPVDRTSSLKSAAVIGVSSFAGAVVPVIPFAFGGTRLAMSASVVASGALLFVLGAVKASLTTGSRTKSGAELAVIGIVSAVFGWLVGALLGPGP